MIPRSKWGAMPITKGGQKVDPSRRTGVVIHHSVTAEGKSQADVEKILRQIDSFHRSRGWGGIGYNIAVDYAGRIYEARGIDILGAHTSKRNTPNYGVVYIGDTRKNLTPDAVIAMQHVIDMLQAHSRKKLNVTGHGMLMATACPGPMLRAEIEKGKFERPFPAVPSKPATPPAPPVAPPAGKHVTVQRGDSYWHIAARSLGVPNVPRNAIKIGRESRRIQLLNKNQALHPGMKVRIQ
jgi:hypothetical protein